MPTSRIPATLTAVALLTFAASASAQLVNGDFELGPCTDPFSNHTVGFTGWTVTLGSVDHMCSNALWDSAGGVRDLDLNGDFTGGVEQSFATEIGKLYEVEFWIGGNLYAGPVVKELEVSVAGVTQRHTFDGTGLSPHITAADWEYRSFTFMASAMTSTLSFTSLVPSAHGPAIDEVKVTELIPLSVRYDWVEAEIESPTSAVRIRWRTILEEGTRAFLVERAESRDGHYRPIGTPVRAAGAGTYEVRDQDGAPYGQAPPWYRIVELTVSGRGDESTAFQAAGSGIGSGARRARGRRR